MACGKGAVLSHRSAATLWALLSHPADAPAIDVTVSARRVRGGRGIRVRHVGLLRRAEATRLRGIPITTPARTLLDLAAVASARELEQAAAEALARSLTTRTGMLSLLARHLGRPGTVSLRSLLERNAGPALTRSEAERRLLTLVRKARLPAPDVNVLVGRYEVDFLWRDARLVVEVDGFAFHGNRSAFELDRRRDADLAAQGCTVTRVTWRQLVDEPEAVLARIAQALARLQAK